MPERFRYLGSSLVGDYARALVGITVSALPIFIVKLNLIVAGIFSVLVLLFSFFAIRTLQRHATIIETTNVHIAMLAPFERRFVWKDVEIVDLVYFSTWRDRDKGWMQLKVKGNDGVLRIESSINRFDEIAAIVAECATRNGASMNEVTIGNFRALGITVGGSVNSVAKLGDVDR